MWVILSAKILLKFDKLLKIEFEMKSLLEIEASIKQLPISDARKLAGWLNEYLDDDWDRQMKADIAAGKLDHLIAKVKSDIKVNPVRDLDEVLDNT